MRRANDRRLENGVANWNGFDDDCNLDDLLLTPQAESRRHDRKRTGLLQLAEAANIKKQPTPGTLCRLCVFGLVFMLGCFILALAATSHRDELER